MDWMSSAQENTIVKLLFEPRTHVAGERIVGTVELDLKKAHEDDIELVRVKLRGVATTRITQRQNRRHSHGRRSGSRTHVSHISLVRQDLTLWCRGNYPAGAQTTSLPFEFQLPANLPGSFCASSIRDSATISYSIEVVADRPGLLRFNRRTSQIFPLLPAATEEHAFTASQLSQGWTGAWTSAEKSTTIRKGLWGDRSSVEAQFICPALQSFPVGVAIPVSIIVTTYTKPMIKSDALQETLSANSSTPLFPAPPADPADVRLQLARSTEFKAEGYRAKVNEHLTSLGGFSARTQNAQGHIRTTAAEPLWISDDESKGSSSHGRWKREVRFDSTIKLRCAPTTNISIIQCAYELVIEVPFPGLGNDLNLRIAIHVDSGVSPSSLSTTRVLPVTLDLPPSYFEGQAPTQDEEENVFRKSG